MKQIRIETMFCWADTKPIRLLVLLEIMLMNFELLNFATSVRVSQINPSALTCVPFALRVHMRQRLSKIMGPLQGSPISYRSPVKRVSGRNSFSFGFPNSLDLVPVFNTSFRI